jgi:5-methylcytosine-specific restriction endonuclease McrA
MFRVLLLNADYEPLNICSLKRALSLILNNKADYLHTSDKKKIKCVSGIEFDFPTVIRLKYQVKRNYNRIYKVSRLGVYARDNFTCQYCGKKNVDLSLDHVYPKYLGGTHTWDNLVTSCKKCNGIKGWKTLEQSGMKLINKPKIPNTSFKTALKHHRENDFEEWDFYLQ